MILGAIFVSCSSLPTIPQYEEKVLSSSAVLSSKNNDYSEIQPSKYPKTGNSPIKSLDGNVEYYINSEIPDVNSYPIAYVSPHKFTVQDAQNAGKAIFGDAQFTEYVYNKPIPSSEWKKNIERWEAYLSDGTVRDLFKDNKILIDNYNLVLSRFKEKNNTNELSPENEENKPYNWEFHPDSFYYGELADKEPQVIRTIVENEGIKYRFDVVNRTTDDFCVYMMSAYLYNSTSPNNIDTLVQQYNLCKSCEPSPEQIQYIANKASTILKSLNIGNWVVDDCYSNRLSRGNQEAYIITVRATPVFSNLATMRQEQLLNLRSDLDTAQHFYYTDAEFTFSPDGVLLTCTIQSPVDVKQVDVIQEVLLDKSQLLQFAKEHLARKGVGQFLGLYSDNDNISATVKAFITDIEIGMVRLEIANGMSYCYVPGLCLQGYFEIYSQQGELLMDSSSHGLCRMLEVNMLDGTEICFSAENKFTFLTPQF